MLSRIKQWFASEKEWRREHRASWQGATVPGRDELTPFQRSCEEALSSHLATRGLRLSNRTIARMAAGGSLLAADVASTGISVWILPDGAQAGVGQATLRLEEWDARTPEELITRFLSELDTLFNT